jgi:GDP-4-dehydro-6-deoxy-D-mannose reductase
VYDKKVLITGSEGFAGRTLCAYLAASGIKVYGCDLTVPPDDPQRRACDMSNEQQVLSMLEWAGKCDYVFHLAAASSVAQSMRAPAQCMRANIEGLVHLCESISVIMPEVRLIFIGSAEVYGPPAWLPLTEKHPVNPGNPYAISKLAGEHYCQYMHQNRGLDVVLLRPFNHSGPGQQTRFVLSDFARQLVDIEQGKSEPVLRVGNLSARRDFLHVSDVVRAYWLAAESAHGGDVYNICSGEAISIREALEQLCARAHVSVQIEVDPERYRPADIPELRGDYTKIKDHTGWTPQLPFSQVLEDLLHYWRGMFCTESIFQGAVPEKT